jgi:predicted homoserine dehydrogenase-like protein
MIIVDTEIAKRVAEDRPIQVAMIGAGYSARHIASQILSSFPGIHLAVIVNRTESTAREIFENSGVRDVRSITSAGALEDAIATRSFCTTDDASVVFEAESIEAVIETTGEIEYGAWAALNSISAGKHTFVLNCEMDATVGPILKHKADQKGIIFSNSDGDEPGVASNLARHVKTMGLEVVGAGNLKGFYDPYRTPETQKGFAEANNQKAHMMTSFVDGTKLSMELTVTANALGFGVGKRGMYGPACDDVRTCLEHFPEDWFRPGAGVVDYLLGASPYTGAFVIGHTEHPMKQEYLKYLKMGDGPLYVFYTPFHLPQLEIPITVARGVLCNDAAVAPRGKPYCEAVAIAKRNLKKGEKLDGIGGFTNYTLIENFDISKKESLLPMGVSQNCVLKRDVAIDTALSYEDVEIPRDRLIDTLRDEMLSTFC